MTVQPDLCQTSSETTLLVFPREGSFVNADIEHSNFVGKANATDIMSEKNVYGLSELVQLWDPS